MNDFIPLQKGQDNWHDKYNQDLEALYSQMQQLASQNEVLQAQLANKISIVEKLDWKDLDLTEGFAPVAPHTPQCCALGNLVFIRGVVRCEEGEMPMETVFAELPKGYSPEEEVFFTVPTSMTGGGGSARLWISHEGKLAFSFTTNQSSANHNVCLFCSYLKGKVL